MRRPILLDNPPPPPLPSVRWSRFLQSRYLSIGGLAVGGVAAVVGASVALAMLVAPDVPARSAPADMSASAAKSGPVAVKAAASAATNGVQMVGEVKQTDRPCDEQTWPYIAAHCLKPASEQKPAAAAARVAVDRSELKTSRAGMPSLAAAPTPAVAEAPVVPQPDRKVVAAPEMAAPMPAARPASHQAVRDDAQQKRSRSATAPRDIRPDIRAEARRAQASDRNPPPAVRRWTEAEYDVPGPFGSTRRVVVIRPQSIHQAAAFNEER